MRHFALTTLKYFGMGKRANEDKIIEESQYLINVFKEKEGNKPFTQELQFYIYLLCIIL